MYRKILLIMLLSLGQAVSAEYIIAPSGLNLRDKPDLAARVVATIPFGGKVTVLQKQKDNYGNGWYLVVWGDKRGWIFFGFLAKDKPEHDHDIDLSLFFEGPLFHRDREFDYNGIAFARMVLPLPVSRDGGHSWKPLPIDTVWRLFNYQKHVSSWTLFGRSTMFLGGDFSLSGDEDKISIYSLYDGRQYGYRFIRKDKRWFLAGYSIGCEPIPGQIQGQDFIRFLKRFATDGRFRISRTVLPFRYTHRAPDGSWRDVDVQLRSFDEVMQKSFIVSTLAAAFSTGGLNIFHNGHQADWNKATTVRYAIKFNRSCERTCHTFRKIGGEWKYVELMH
jgi:hypothetical protein